MVDEQREILNLSDIRGYCRLYATMLGDGTAGKRILSDRLYEWYSSNVCAYNDRYGETIIPLNKETFCHKLQTEYSRPYKTDIQTIKALTLLEWNMSDRPEHSKAQQTICETNRDLGYIFHEQTGYYPQNVGTSFALCGDTLDPTHEPENELNPHALVRKFDAGTKLIYVCAPLRGDVEKNIEFARSKAKEVFAEGNIPICPHLMFPPIANPANPAEDKAAMEMCLKLIDRCNELHVYGNEWTDGMWKEIHHAEQMKIPVFTDQREIPKSRTVMKANRSR